MNNFQANYNKILEVLNKFESKDYFLSQIRTPKLSSKSWIQCCNAINVVILSSILSYKSSMRLAQ